MTEPDNSRITIEETSSGIIMRIIVAPRATDAGELFIYLGSAGASLAGVLVTAQGGDAMYVGLLFLSIGIFGIALSFYNRNRVWRGSDALYRVSSAKGMVTFARDDYEQTFELAKLGRIWFTERTRNGQPSGVDLTAYYDGRETLMLDIIELSSVSDDADEFLDSIGEYLNNTSDADHAALTSKRPDDHATGSSPQAENELVANHNNTADATHEVLIGFRPDYATGTSSQAKDQRELASSSLRLFFSSLAALPMLVYFSDQSHWPVNLFIGIVVAPILFALAVSFSRSCTCRYRRPADFVIWPMIAALAGLALKVMSDFMATKEGLPGLSFIIMPVIFLLMTGIIYRVVSGCSCGARPQSH